MLYKVFARTRRTDWVEINAFESKDEAMTLAREVLSDVGTEVMIEQQLQISDDIKGTATETTCS